MSDDEHTTSPVRRARDRALEAKLRYDQGRHGLADRELITLRRQWQTYLWHYYGQIAGYKETRNIRDKWHEPIDPEDHPDSLAQIVSPSSSSMSPSRVFCETQGSVFW